MLLSLWFVFKKHCTASCTSLSCHYHIFLFYIYVITPEYNCGVVLVAQSCPTVFDPMDCSPPDSSVPGILQARILEWVASPFLGELPDPGIGPRSPALQRDSLLSEPPGKALTYVINPEYSCLYFKQMIL